MLEVSTGRFLLGPLNPKRKRPPVAHCWDGSDTLCRMWSTGGMNRGGDWRVTHSAEGRRICQMCVNAPSPRPLSAGLVVFRGTGSPTAEEIEAAKTPHGGWTRRQLAAWGVPWPPPAGWKESLLGEASHADRS